MPLSKFQKAVKSAAAYYAPTLGLDPSQLEHAMLTIASLEGGLGEEAGIGDGGASVGRYQFNTRGGHGETLLKQGYSIKDISDDEFQAWHWAPILGQALKSRIDSGMSPDKAIIQAGFDVERPAAMYDSGRAAQALKTASSLTGTDPMNGRQSTSDGISFNFGDQPLNDGGSSSPSNTSWATPWADASANANKNLSNAQNGTMSTGAPTYAQFLGALGQQQGNNMSNLLPNAGAKMQKASSPESVIGSKLNQLTAQINQYKLAGKPVPADLMKQFNDLSTWMQTLTNGPTDPTTQITDQANLLNALANVYGTGVQSGTLKANAADKMLTQQLAQAPFLKPHDYKPGFGPGGFMEAAYGSNWNPEDWKAQKVELDDPHLITQGADGGMQGVIDAIMGTDGVSVGGGSTQEPNKVGQAIGGVGNAISDAVDGFLGQQKTPSSSGNGAFGGAFDKFGSNPSGPPEKPDITGDMIKHLLGVFNIPHQAPTSPQAIVQDLVSLPAWLGNPYGTASSGANLAQLGIDDLKALKDTGIDWRPW